jgi:sensor c-di-GMP phosphodiesterase-like protein
MRLVASAAAVVTGLAVAVAGGLLIGHMESSRLRGVSKAAEQLIKWNIKDSMSTLRYAKDNIEPRCSEKSLFELRKMIMANRYIAQFSIFNEQGQIACSTTAGMLDDPIDVPQPDLVSANGEDRFAYNFNLVLKTGNIGAITTVARLGRFAAVTNPVETQNIYASGVDAIQVVNNEGKLFTIFRSNRITEEALAGADGDGQGAGHFGWSSSMEAFSLVTRAEGTRVVLRTIVTPSEIFGRYSVVVVAILSLAGIVSFLAYAAAMPAMAVRRSLANRLEGLLTPDNVICLLQPIIDLKTGRISGCEVLMRLKSDDEVLMPNDIIPAVLARSLTTKFDTAVIARAARDLEGMDLPEGFKVSVNFFPGTFKHGVALHLLQHSFQELRSRGVKVCVEVIEQDASSDIMGELVALKDAGYEISVDDFGTGYSNLGTVRQMTPHYLKIDRSFVHEMEDGAVRSTLIPEIIAIARAVNADVVAEGIENQAQATRLKDLGAEFGQGYFFARPLTLEAFQQRLSREPSLPAAA